jgi:hypothetical protein
VTIVRMSHAEWRAFLRTWTGGVDEDCGFVVLDGSDREPKRLNDRQIEVGERWLKKNAIPREALTP